MVYPTLLAAVGDVAYPAWRAGRSASTGCGGCPEKVTARLRAHVQCAGAPLYPGTPRAVVVPGGGPIVRLSRGTTNALIRLHRARAAARFGTDGGLVLLRDQDPAAAPARPLHRPGPTSGHRRQGHEAGT
jgi:hypothetical protein